MLMFTKPLETRDIIEAISLHCSPVLGSLNIANAISGAQTDAWRAVREFSLSQLVDEAVLRGCDLSEVKAACCAVLVYDTPPFHGAVGFDPRRRCALCCRRHFKPREGDLSCGDAARFRAPPVWKWTRATAEAAIEAAP